MRCSASAWTRWSGCRCAVPPWLYNQISVVMCGWQMLQAEAETEIGRLSNELQQLQARVKCAASDMCLLGPSSGSCRRTLTT